MSDQEEIDLNLTCRYLLACYRGWGFTNHPSQNISKLKVETTYAGLNLAKVILSEKYSKIKAEIYTHQDSSFKEAIQILSNLRNIDINSLARYYRAALLLKMLNKTQEIRHCKSPSWERLINGMIHIKEPLRRLYEITVVILILNQINRGIANAIIEVLRKFRGKYGFCSWNRTSREPYFRSNYNAFSILGILLKEDLIDHDRLMEIVSTTPSLILKRIDNSWRKENDGFSLYKRHHPVLWDQYDAIALLRIISDLDLVDSNHIQTVINQKRCMGLKFYLAKCQVQKTMKPFSAGDLGGFRSSVHSTKTSLLQTNVAFMILSLCNILKHDLDFYQGIFV